MKRSTCIVIALLFACAVIAAPAPQQRLPVGLGKPIDPDKNCKFRHDKDALTIEMPGTEHDYDPLRECVNAPRLLRDLEGDFEMQIRVRINCRPSAKSTVESQPSLVASGFLLIPPDGFPTTCIRIEYGISRQGEVWDNYVAMKDRSVGGGRMNGIWDKGYKHWPFTTKTEQAYLKLARRSNTFYPYLSEDGEKWTLLVGGAEYLGLPAKLKLGLAAYTTSNDPSKVRIDRIKLTQGKKKAR